MIYLCLFYEYFKIGLFAIGGGLATIPFLQKLIQKPDGNAQGFGGYDCYIGINSRSHRSQYGHLCGFQTAGIGGAVIATLGLVTPSVIIIVIIAHYFMRFAEEPLVKAGFTG